jgi:hypothetical protein
MANPFDADEATAKLDESMAQQRAEKANKKTRLTAILEQQSLLRA